MKAEEMLLWLFQLKQLNANHCIGCHETERNENHNCKQKKIFENENKKQCKNKNTRADENTHTHTPSTVN